MLALIGRIVSLLPLITSSVVGLVQVLIKALKEIVTAVIDLTFPFFPDAGKFETAVLAVRDAIDRFDGLFAKLRDWLIKTTGIKL